MSAADQDSRHGSRLEHSLALRRLGQGMDALSLSTAPARQLRLLAVLMRETWAWNTDDVGLSLTEIAERTALGRSHITRALRALEAAGVCRRTAEGNTRGQSRPRNRYTMHPPEDWLPPFLPQGTNRTLGPGYEPATTPGYEPYPAPGYGSTPDPGYGSYPTPMVNHDTLTMRENHGADPGAAPAARPPLSAQLRLTEHRAAGAAVDQAQALALAHWLAEEVQHGSEPLDDAALLQEAGHAAVLIARFHGYLGVVAHCQERLKERRRRPLRLAHVVADLARAERRVAPALERATTPHAKSQQPVAPDWYAGTAADYARDVEEREAYRERQRVAFDASMADQDARATG